MIIIPQSEGIKNSLIASEKINGKKYKKTERRSKKFNSIRKAGTTYDSLTKLINGITNWWQHGSKSESEYPKLLLPAKLIMSLKHQKGLVSEEENLLISKTRCNPSETALDASKKKSTTSAKGRTNGRKALGDITNSGKPLLTSAPKKNVNPLSVVPEDIGEERFIHNHADCIKAQTRSVDMDEFLEIVGLKNDFSKKFATPLASHVPHKVKVDTPLRHLELLETAEKMVGHQSQKRTQLREINSPYPWATPESPKHFMQWKDIDCVNFKLIGTPEFLKH
ncbi:hypothetical protein Tsubulata_018357 [Turnera subulata]|uniref:Uncharacterized protein n=1 Tax=Turnera subulata TaxID=218843 RepID=A0A9Q0FMN1_9ROSI|nr:hypothetical protein Tsubulata_018357 [Turnera subulata]